MTLTVRELALEEYIRALLADGELKRSESVAVWISKIPACIGKDIRAVGEVLGRNAAERVLNFAGQVAGQFAEAAGKQVGGALMGLAREIGKKK